MQVIPVRHHQPVTGISRLRALCLVALLCLCVLNSVRGQAPGSAPALAPAAAPAGPRSFLGSLRAAGSAVAGAVTTAADRAADAVTNTFDNVRDRIAGSGAPGPLAAAPSPRPGPVYSNVSNLVFSVTGGSAKFTNATLTISDVSPAVSFFTSVPIWHGGVMNTSFFSSETLVYNGSWLGDPDAALYGTDKAGKKVVVLLTIGAPVLKGSKLTFAAYHLPTTENPLLRGGVVDAVILGTRAGNYQGPQVLQDPGSSTDLVNVALLIDNALAEFPVPSSLKSAQLGAVDDSGFTYDCFANTPWKPIWCGSAYYGGWFG
eukprot:jgi/Botrbrau1/13924/Bobra.136_2s0012.1